MRRVTLFASVATGVLLALVLARPVLLAPVTGDDVYYALRTSANGDRTVLTEIRTLPAEWRRRVEKGRVNALTGAERRLTGRALVDTSVATGRPVNQVQAVLRIGYATLSLLGIYALLRSLRWRRRDTGALVRMSPGTRRVAMLAGTVITAAGAQAQLVAQHGSNGWVSYPASTWTAMLSIVAVPALALWLSRLTAARARIGPPAALLLAAIGAATNFRYELTFVAFPLTLLALALVPVTGRDDRARGRRAKIALGAAYAVGFLPVLVWNRVLVSRVCAASDCYDGVDPSLSPGPVLRAWAENVASSVPGTSPGVVADYLRSQAVRVDGAWIPTGWSLLAAGALLVVLALIWRAGGGPADGVDPADDPADGAADDGAAAHAQAQLCLVAAALLVCAAVGAAAVMALSDGAQARTGWGVLYRHSVVTWTGLAFAVVLLVLCASWWRPALGRWAFAGLAVVMAVLVAVKLPADDRIMAANASRMQPTIGVFDELVRGEPGREAEQRRCAVLDDVGATMNDFYAGRVQRQADNAYRKFWGEPFCPRP